MGSLARVTNIRIISTRAVEALFRNVGAEEADQGDDFVCADALDSVRACSVSSLSTDHAEKLDDEGARPNLKCFEAASHRSDATFAFKYSRASLREKKIIGGLAR